MVNLKYRVELGDWHNGNLNFEFISIIDGNSFLYIWMGLMSTSPKWNIFLYIFKYYLIAYSYYDYYYWFVMKFCSIYSLENLLIVLMRL